MKVFFNNCLACPRGEISFSPKDDLDTIFTMCRERWGDGRMCRVNNEYIWTKSTDHHGPFKLCPTCRCCADPCKCDPPAMEERNPSGGSETSSDKGESE